MKNCEDNLMPDSDNDSDLEDLDEFETSSPIKSKEEINDKKRCKNCNSERLIIIRNEACITCNACGLVNSKIFDYFPEGSNYDDKGDNSTRCGSIINNYFPKNSTSTIISFKGSNRLRQLHLWEQSSYKERSLGKVHQTIDEKCLEKNIKKSVRDGAKSIYNKLTELKHVNDTSVIFRGNNRKSIIAACVYYSSFHENQPCTDKQIAEMFEIKPTNLTNGCKKLDEYLNNKKILDDIHFPDSYKYIKSFYGKLNIDIKYAEIAMKICINVDKLEEISHKPKSMAAGILFLVCKLYSLKISKKDISKLLDTSDVTICKILKELEPIKNIILDDELTLFWIKNPDDCIKYLNQQANQKCE